MSNVYHRLVSASPEIQELADIWPCGFLFKLSPGANIIVAGAYRGRVMELLATLYPDYGRLIGFEPQDNALAVAAKRLDSLGLKHELYNYGIGTQDGTLPMYEYGAEFAGFVNSDPALARTEVAYGQGQIFEFSSVLSKINLSRIHLLLLNMEGYEFELLPHLVNSNLFYDGKIERLCMQVHWLDQSQAVIQRFDASINHIQHTHKRVFDELPQWGFWEYSGVKD